MLAQYTAEISDALAFMHSNKNMHCNIKPESLLLRAGNQIKIADFGLEVMTMVKHMQHCRLVLYLAPEVICGGPDDKMIDVWWLGVVVSYKCLY